MQLSMPHSWNLTYAEAVAAQESLKDRVICDRPLHLGKLRYVAGCDVAYETRRSCRPGIAEGQPSACFCAAVVVMRWPSLEIVEQRLAEAATAFPYIPGLLTFREGPALQGAFEQLQQRPDVVMFDGQGIAHPRRMGLASHMGLLLGVPTVGSAKTRLCGETSGTVGPNRGSKRGLYLAEAKGGKSRQRIGTVLRTRSGVKPVFVSCGHLVDLPGCERLVLASTRGCRLPEPIRAAHRLVNARLRQVLAEMEQD